MSLEELMTTEEIMHIQERRKYLRMMQARYFPTDRQGRGQLLDEMEKMTGLDRKVLIRLMHSDLQRQPRRRERGSVYGAAVQDAIQIIAETLDYPCAERLTPGLAPTARQLAAHGELAVPPELAAQLEQVSISTVKRLVGRRTQDQPRLRQAGRATQHPLTEGIPMLILPWDEPVPGAFEIDLVHHCGPSTDGDYVHTLQWIDITTGWSERAAVLGRSFLVMQNAFTRILARLPFPPRILHPDNGAEFLNYHLLRFVRQELPEVQLARSRPRRKNDNRFVEQKNSSLVRAFLGQARLDTVAQTCALNDIYDQMWLYYNFFQPVLRLQAKESLPTASGGYRIKYHYDEAQTPLERLRATDVLTPARREQLEALYDQTNPRLLRQAIYDALEQLWALPGAVPGQSEDVRRTLYTISPPADVAPVTLSFGLTTSPR
jgi:hypothetical protein